MDGKDPMCDADNPTKLQFEDVTSAAFKIKGGILSTPCMVRYFDFNSGKWGSMRNRVYSL